MIHLKLGLLIGLLNKYRFNKICSFIKVSKSKYVGAFLCKLRISLSNNHQTFWFGVSEQTIANYINLAREDLLKNLVPKLLNNCSVLINHNTSMAKMLFDIPENKACSIFDAIYKVVQKSKNFSEQKQLWNKQKKCS